MIRTKKSLGQNFLTSKKALADILKAAKIEDKETVLEIGPGRGALTTELLRSGAKVIAVEKDGELVKLLQEKFIGEIANSQLTLIHQDILEFKPENYRLSANNYKLVANIPYYITGQIFRKFLQSDYQPKSVVLLVQKEVADRIIATDGKESLLSISVKVYGEPKRIAVVKAGSFVPAPKVDSAIISISNVSKKSFSKIDESEFFEILKSGFAHKRKLLSGNLKSKAPEIEKILEKLKINKKSRAENLKANDWLNLIKEISVQA